MQAARLKSTRRARRKQLVEEILRIVKLESPVVFGVGGLHEFTEDAFHESRHALAQHENAVKQLPSLVSRLWSVNSALGIAPGNIHHGKRVLSRKLQVKLRQELKRQRYVRTSERNKESLIAAARSTNMH